MQPDTASYFHAFQRSKIIIIALSMSIFFSTVHSFFLHLLLSSRHFFPPAGLLTWLLKKNKKKRLPSLTCGAPLRPLCFISLCTLLISTCLAVSVRLSVPPPPQGASGVLREWEHVQGAPQAVLHQKPKIQWVALCFGVTFFVKKKKKLIVWWFSFLSVFLSFFFVGPVFSLREPLLNVWFFPSLLLCFSSALVQPVHSTWA